MKWKRIQWLVHSFLWHSRWPSSRNTFSKYIVKWMSPTLAASPPSVLAIGGIRKHRATAINGIHLIVIELLAWLNRILSSTCPYQFDYVRLNVYILYCIYMKKCICMVTEWNWNLTVYGNGLECFVPLPSRQLFRWIGNALASQCTHTRTQFNFMHHWDVLVAVNMLISPSIYLHPAGRMALLSKSHIHIDQSSCE